MSGRPTVHQAIALLAAVSILPAIRLDGFPLQVAVALILVAGWRMVTGGEGDALAGFRARVALRAVSVIATFLLLAAMTRGVLSPLAGLLVLLAMIQALSLIEAQAPFISFLTILLATAQVTGAAFVREDSVGLVLTLLALATLLGAALLFERRMASLRVGMPGTSVHRVRIGDPQHVPRGAFLGTFTGLWVAGLLGGVALTLALPWVASLRGSSEEVVEEAEAASAEDPFTSITGPDLGAKGIRLGDIGRIKVDLTPYMEVRLPGNREPLLRESTYDQLRGRDWIATEGQGIPAPRKVGTDERNAGWVPLERDEGSPRGFFATITMLRGPMPRLWLEPVSVRARFWRGEQLLRRTLFIHDNEQTDVVPPLMPGDSLETLIVPPIEDQELLELARSDAGVAPRPGYLQLPERCRPLADEARRIVGEEESPWIRALHLVDWLRDGDFTYTLEMPAVDTDRPVVDFVLRAKRGHCEYFAAALTLMLRGLGHPARMVKGFRGGDWQPTRGTWIVRGSHTHAWTEIFLDPYGWIALDATPPDDEAVDAATRTQEANDPLAEDTDAEDDWLASLLGLSEEDQEAIAAFFTNILDRFVLAPLGFLFGPRGLFVGFVLIALVWGLRHRRRSSVAWEREHGPRAGRKVIAPYLEALKLLSSVGLRRGRSATPREFLGEVRMWAPEVKDDLAWLTVVHERMRYGAKPVGAELERQARGRVGDLGRALKRRGRGRQRA